jgi:hypothetical protein
MALLMMSLESKSESFGDFGGSKSEIISEVKSRENEDPK